MKSSNHDDLTQGSPGLMSKSEFNPQQFIRRSSGHLNPLLVLPSHNHTFPNEPQVDYDQSETEDPKKEDDRFEARRSSSRKNSRLLELSSQQTIFVATPAAAAIMRRQGSEKLRPS